MQSPSTCNPCSVHTRILGSVRRAKGKYCQGYRCEMNFSFSLADLIPGAPTINIVHIGASILPDMPEPYAPLVAAGRARVTAFEPNQAEHAKMKAALREGYTILPYFI